MAETKEANISGKSNLPLDELALRCAAGEEECFAPLASHFAPFLSRMIASLSVPPEEREDLKQEGLIGLFKAVLLFNPEISSFSTFASVCMRSSVLDELRRYRKAQSGNAFSPFLEESIPAEASETPERILMGKEALNTLLKKVDKALSPMERRVFGLYLSGKKGSEIASLLGKNQKSVENSLFRLRKKLSVLS